MTIPIAESTLETMESLLHSVTRYTRFVRSTKVMLAVLAALLTGAVLFYSFIKKDSGVRIAFTSVEKKSASSPTQMLNAHFHGLDQSNQPFHVSAKTATQLDDDTVSLDQVTGDVTLNNSTWLSVSSNTGTFKMKEQLLELKGSIEMFDDEGYEFRTEHMHVDVKTKMATTDVEVRGQGVLGILKAKGGANIDGNGKKIFFKGPVFVTVFPYHENGSRVK